MPEITNAGPKPAYPPVGPSGISSEHDPVNHPTHYAGDAKCDSCGESIEAIQVTRHMGFNLGNAIKYIWRAGKKDDIVQDLKKAVWYLQDQIAMLEGKQNPNVHRLSATTVEQIESDLRDRIDLNENDVLLSEAVEARRLLQVADNVPCSYTYTSVTSSVGILDGDYFCKIHHSPTRHHVREGANRPCEFIESINSEDE